jgi:hypothetical protein
MAGAERARLHHGQHGIMAAAVICPPCRALQVRRICKAVRKKVDPSLELPRNVLCMKWRNGAHWAVLEANLETKEFRILYVDPYDGHQKSWNVSLTLEAYASMHSG